MAKLADAIHFDYIEELCEEILDRLNNYPTLLTLLYLAFHSFSSLINPPSFNSRIYKLQEKNILIIQVFGWIK